MLTHLRSKWAVDVTGLVRESQYFILAQCWLEYLFTVIQLLLLKIKVNTDLMTIIKMMTISMIIHLTSPIF